MPFQTHSNCSSVYAVPGDMASKGVHFYYEAKRLFEDEDEDERIRLPTVQGLGLLTALYGHGPCTGRSTNN